MSAYYNEIDPYAAQWIRNLITAGHITDGIVDERSIKDVHPIELKEFTQCHFFAGIGVWSLALRMAGWPDDRPAWTGSCPCQPFSAAGKGVGFTDERHLWPAFHHLIAECRPAVVFGEQVASKDADAWIDLVQDDMEAMGYAFGAVPFPAAGVGAPHIRDRMYWVADADRSPSRQGGSDVRGRISGSAAQQGAGPGGGGLSDRVGHPDGTRPQGRSGRAQGEGQRIALPGDAERLADAHGGLQPGSEPRGGAAVASSERAQSSEAIAGYCGDRRPGPVNGLWGDADWLFCRDGKWRPVEPGTFPLADGAPARVGRLRAYGNAIVPQVAAEFIGAYLDCRP